MSGNPGWLKPLQRLMQNQHQLTMLNLLPRGLAVEVTPFPVGIRGSFHEPRWLKILNRFGVSSQSTQSRFQQEQTRQVLKELDRMKEGSQGGSLQAAHQVSCLWKLNFTIQGGQAMAAASGGRKEHLLGWKLLLVLDWTQTTPS